MLRFQTGQLQARKKNTAGRGEAAAYKPIVSVNRFERILDKRTTRCVGASWCRTCLSDHCCLDYKEPPECTDLTDETGNEFAKKLQFLKQKRASTEAYINHLDKVNTSCRLNIVSQPYFLSQDHLSPWLTDVVERDLCIPVVPTFPTSREKLDELVSALDLEHSDDAILEDYETAALYGRRVRLGVQCKSQSERAAVASLHQYYCLCEEITDGSERTVTDSENDCTDGRSNQYFLQRFAENRARLRQKLSMRIHHGCNRNVIRCFSNRTPTGVSSARTSNEKQKGVLSSEVDLKQVQSSLAWVPYYVCPKAIIQECSGGRVLITGDFPTDKFGDLHFKLVLFPGERFGTKHMRLSGSYIRSAERSHYNLKWKYDVRVRIT